MSTKHKWLHYIGYGLLVLCFIIICAVAFLFTKPGFKTLCWIIEKSSSNKITLQQPTGSLASSFSIDQMIYHTTNNTTHIKQFHGELNTKQLWHGIIDINTVSIKSGQITMVPPSTNDTNDNESNSSLINQLPQSLSWPTWLKINHAKLNDLHISYNNKKYYIANISLDPQVHSTLGGSLLKINFIHPKWHQWNIYYLPMTDQTNIHLTSQYKQYYIQVHAKLTKKALHITDFTVEHLHTTIIGSASYIFGKTPSIIFKSYFNQFNYNNIIFNGYITGKLLTRNDLDIHAHIKSPNQTNIIYVNLYHQKQWHGDWDINIPNTHKLLTSSKGYIKAKGQYKDKHLYGTGDIQLNHLNINNWSIHNLQTHWQAVSSKQETNSLASSIQNLSFNNKTVTNILLSIQGYLPNHHISLSFTTPWNQTITTKLDGKYSITNNKWHGLIKTFNIKTQHNLTWQLKKPVDINYNNQQWSLSQLELLADKYHISLHGNYNLKSNWQIDSDGYAPLYWSQIPPSLYNHSLLKYSATIKGAKNSIKMIAADPSMTGQLHIKLNKKQHTYNTNLSNSINYKNKKIAITSKMLLNKNNIGNLNINSTFSTISKASSMPLTGHIHINLNDNIYSNIINQFTNQIKMNSSLLVDNTIHGTLSAPTFNGYISQPGTMYIDALNKTFTNTKLKISSTNKINTTLTALLDKQPLTLTGTYNSSNFESSWAFKNKAIQIINTHNKTITAAPDLSLQCYQLQCTLTGSIYIPKADYHYIPAYSFTTLPMNDIQFVHNNVDYNSWIPTIHNLAISFGNNVTFRGYGIKGLVEGKIKLNKEKQTPLLLEGIINLKDGTFTYGSTKLTLTVATLSYLNTPYNNPHLQIMAQKKVYIYATPQSEQQSGNIIVGLNITGVLKRPIVNLYSDSQDLSQASILSYLLLNQATITSSIIDPSTLYTLGSDGLNNSPGLLTTLKNKLGLTELGLETASTGNTTSNSDVQNELVIGKKIFKKVYLRYSLGLKNYLNTWMLIYQINKHWSFQSSQNFQSNRVDASAIDLLYQFSK